MCVVHEQSLNEVSVFVSGAVCVSLLFCLFVCVSVPEPDNYALIQSVNVTLHLFITAVSLPVPLLCLCRQMLTLWIENWPLAGIWRL